MNKPYLNTMSIRELEQIENNTVCAVLDPITFFKTGDYKKTMLCILTKMKMAKYTLFYIEGYNNSFSVLVEKGNNPINIAFFQSKELIKLLRSRKYILVNHMH